MYIVCELESDIDIARSLTGNKYKFQRVDGKWITPYIQVDDLPGHTLEEESLTWYDPNSKQYNILYNKINDDITKSYITIDLIYNKLKDEFSAENVIMGITQMGQTSLVMESLKDFDYCMRNRAIDEVWSVIDKIPRSTPFLTEERINNMKTKLYTSLSENSII